MKKWKEFNRSEKNMVIVMGILLIAVILSSVRIWEGLCAGLNIFF